MTAFERAEWLFVGLTDRERDVTCAVAAGRSNKAIARDLSVSVKTVEFHLGNVYRKLNVASRGELAHLVHEATTSRVGGADPVGSAARSTFVRNLSAGHVEDLVGRGEEMELVEAACAHRLVTVVGVGGVGKTTVAVAIAERLAGRYTGGAWFVDLTAVNRDGDVPSVIAQALQVRGRDGGSIAAGLSTESRLVVLDNCEHVIEGVVGVVERVVTSCPKVTVLATSRERLDLAAEHVVSMGPLPLVGEIGAAGTSPAAELFRARARRLLGRFEPDDAELVEVDAVCEAVDGLPLAIELAAGRLPSMSLGDLAVHVGDRLAVLRRRRARGERHDSLRATMAWSYELLTSQERRLFESLAVFPGEFDLAAAAVGSTDGDVLELVSALVERSLLVAVRRRAGTRYRMLQTVQAFAVERLHERGDRDVVRLAHLAYYRQLIAQADADFRGPHELRGERAFRSEWLNCRAAFETACELGRLDDALVLLRHAYFFGCTRMVQDLGVWAEQASVLPAMPELRLLATSIRVVFAVLGDRRGEAERLSADALAEDVALGGMGEPWAHWSAVWATYSWVDAVQAAIALEERAGRTGDPFWIAQAAGLQMENAGNSLEDYGSEDPQVVADLRALAARALTLAESVGRPALIGKATLYLGIAFAHASEAEQGRQLMLRSIELGQHTHNWPLFLQGHVELIRLEAALGNLDAVAAHIEVIVSTAEQPTATPSDRNHLTRFSAEVVAAAVRGRDVPAGIVTLQQRIRRLLGSDEYHQRAVTGEREGVAAAVNRYHHVMPW